MSYRIQIILLGPGVKETVSTLTYYEQNELALTDYWSLITGHESLVTSLFRLLYIFRNPLDNIHLGEAFGPGPVITGNPMTQNG